jgi:hypothetical protein
VAGKAKEPKEPAEPRRLNRAVGINEALKGVLDSALKKRGFATRDIFSNWAAMAPKPYDRMAVPAELKWPRGAGHEGATLVVRCAPGQALRLAHEGELIAAAVNRYFGYFLVREVRLSAEPFTAGSAPAKKSAGPSPLVAMKAGAAAAQVDDPALKSALTSLAEGIFTKKPG